MPRRLDTGSSAASTFDEPEEVALDDRPLLHERRIESRADLAVTGTNRQYLLGPERCPFGVPLTSSSSMPCSRMPYFAIASTDAFAFS